MWNKNITREYNLLTRKKKDSNVWAFSIVSFITLSSFLGLLFATSVALESLFIFLVLQTSSLQLDFVLVLSQNTQAILLQYCLFTCSWFYLFYAHILRFSSSGNFLFSQPIYLLKFPVFLYNEVVNLFKNKLGKPFVTYKVIKILKEKKKQGGYSALLEIIVSNHHCQESWWKMAMQQHCGSVPGSRGSSYDWWVPGQQRPLRCLSRKDEHTKV